MPTEHMQEEEEPSGVTWGEGALGHVDFVTSGATFPDSKKPQPLLGLAKWVQRCQNPHQRKLAAIYRGMSKWKVLSTQKCYIFSPLCL